MILRKLSQTMSYAVLVLLAAAVLVPLVYVILKSFTPNELLGQSLFVPERFTLDNYDRVLFDTPFMRYLLNTVFLTVTITIGSLLFDSMAAFGFARMTFPGKELLFLIVISMLVVPAEALLLPRYMVVRDLGWLDDYKALIVPALSSAYTIFFLRQFFLSLPKELEESAVMDGASVWRVYAQIILPLVKAPLLTIGLMVFFHAWDDFLWPLTIINSPDKYVLQVAVSLLDTEFSTDIGAKFSNVVLSSLPIVVLFLVIQRQYISGITSGAIKG
ncbi:carbohydrate ABC transporter permease [Paenibacillus thalictri]|uniref:Carbohydrate ABC transporter permease n=1 Tax=Paenibacillus thalictri TaxID=2527873 RepID=A0A4Q9DIZ4_9BACL|nr:carbohydrate ABC transporter permease [Paenibacillus thalictri]TBL73889.1 carbohydrate ABC transporter permease [Paenibacillus thalictri]